MVGKKILENWVIAVILVLGVILRVARLDYLELFGDEVDAGYQSYSLMTTGHDYKGNSWPVYAQSFSEWRAPGFMYAMMPFIKLLGLNEWGVRASAAFWGILGLIGFYWLLGEYGADKKTRLLCLAVLVISPWHVHYSRSGFELTLMTCLIIWGGFFWRRALIANNWLMAMEGVWLFCLSLYTYNTANILTPLVAMISFVGFDLKQIYERRIMILAVIMVGVGLCLPLANQILFGHAGDRFKIFSVFTSQEVIEKVEKYRNQANNSLASKLIYNKYTVGGERVVFNYSNAFGSNFLFKEGDITFRHTLHMVGNLYWMQLPLVLAGLIELVWKRKKTEVDKLMVLLLLISPVAASLTIDGYNHASRLFLMVFPLAYFTTRGLIVMVEKSPKYGGIIATIIAVIFVFEFIKFQYYYWNSYKLESWRWWQSGYKQAMLGVSQKAVGKAKVLMDSTYEPSLIRYLFWNKVDSKLIWGLNDKLVYDVNGFRGFCVQENICFVDYGNNFIEKLKPGVSYLISQERNVGGGWDWSTSPPTGVMVLETIRNPVGEPIFYWIRKESS